MMSKKRIGAQNKTMLGILSLRRFGKARDGNIVILFTLLFGVLMLFIGGAVDYTRRNMVRADLIESLDAAALAISQYDTLGGPGLRDSQGEDLVGAAREAVLRNYGKDFFNSNFDNQDAFDGGNVTPEFTITERTITAQASGQINSLILPAAYAVINSSQDGNLGVDARVVVTRRGQARFELALVLDSTGSMARDDNDQITSNDADRKITSLKSAVDTLLDILYGPGSNVVDPGIRVGVVPFNAFVNIRPVETGLFNSSWIDNNAIAAYHGANFMHVGEDGIVDLTTKVNHLRLYDSVPGTSWAGCVEARPYPLDEIDTPPGASANITGVLSAPAGVNLETQNAFSQTPTPILTNAELSNVANSRWVPAFVPDGIDCNGTCSNFNAPRSATIDINGAPTVVNFNRNWFDRPSRSPYGLDASYGNSAFIDDDDFAEGVNNSEDRARYAFVVRQFRDTFDTPAASRTPQQEALYDYFLDMNGDLDGDINSDFNFLIRGEFIYRAAYVGWWNSSNNQYDYRYDQSGTIDESVSLSDSGTTGPNQGCPAPILPLTTSKQDVTNHLELVIPQGNTNIANGAIWGMRVLSSAQPFNQGVAYGTTGWTKAALIMTDGDQVIGNFEGDRHFDSAYNAYGYAIQSRMGTGSGSLDMSDPDNMEDQLNEKLLRICRRMKDQEIVVYTIVFGNLNTETENTMRACATEPSEPYYQEATSGTQLEAAFAGVGANLVETHISE